MNYYSKAYNRFNIIHPCKNREFAMIPKVRALRVHSIDSLSNVLNLVHWDASHVKLYRSVAKISEVPNFTYNLSKRSGETSKWFREEFDKLIYEYDLFIDFDRDEESTIYDVLVEVKELLEYFNEYKLPYYVLFSGNKGFQIYIDGKYMPKPFLENGTIQPHKRIAEKIKEAFDFKYLDLSNNGVPNRLCKVPYSLCPTEDKQIEEEMNVALPLSDEQIENFNLEDMKLHNVVVKVNPLNKRSLLERFDDLSEEERIKNVDSFIKSVDI